MFHVLWDVSGQNVGVKDEIRPVVAELTGFCPLCQNFLDPLQHECKTQNLRCIKPETRVPILKKWESPPSSASRPLPDSELDVFFRKAGRVKDE